MAHKRMKTPRPPMRTEAELRPDEARLLLAERRKGTPYTVLSRRFRITLTAIVRLERSAVMG